MFFKLRQIAGTGFAVQRDLVDADEPKLRRSAYAFPVHDNRGYIVLQGLFKDEAVLQALSHETKDPSVKLVTSAVGSDNISSGALGVISPAIVM